MRKISQKINRFFFRNRNKGIPNLLFGVVAIDVLVLLLFQIDPSMKLYYALCFDRDAILHGQVWRLFSYIFLEMCEYNLFFTFFLGVFYCQLQRGIENAWGTLKFNCFYFTSIICLDVCGMIFGSVNASMLNTVLFITFATLFPDTQFRIFFIIPVKARWLGIFDLAYYVWFLLAYSFPMNLMPLFTLTSYFLFFGKDFLNIFPDSWRINASRQFRRKKKSSRPTTIPFRSTGSFAADGATPNASYTHRCTVCGRTDISDPKLEFRYCSRCSGYRCYCIDHINNHVHIE